MPDAAAPLPVRTPAALREQRDVTPRDHELTDAARLTHPAVAFWWGERRVGGANGAYCYLCNRHVVTWARSWPTPEQARLAILAHRDTDHASHP